MFADWGACEAKNGAHRSQENKPSRKVCEAADMYLIQVPMAQGIEDTCDKKISLVDCHAKLGFLTYIP